MSTSTLPARSARERSINIPEAYLEAIEQIENVITDCELALSDVASRVGKAFAMAAGIRELRKLITEEMVAKDIMPLMNTRLGFKTDKDPNRPVWNRETRQKEEPAPYPLGVVKECLIEGLLRGASPVGNEFNIISGQCYFTREFFERKLGELPGVTNVVPSPGVPRFEAGPDGKISKALIRFGLSWKVNGTADCLRDAEGKPGRVFEIKADAYSGADQVIGKATRKAYSSAYKQIMGSDLAPADGEVADVVDGQVVGGGSVVAADGDAGSADLNARARAAVAAKQNGHGTDAVHVSVITAPTKADRIATAAAIIEGVTGKPPVTPEAPKVEEAPRPANKPADDAQVKPVGPEDEYMEWVESLSSQCVQDGMHPDEFQRGLRDFLTESGLATAPYRIDRQQKGVAEQSAKNRTAWWDFRLGKPGKSKK